MVKPELDEEHTEELLELAEQLATVLADKAILLEKEKALKERIKEINSLFRFPRKEKASEYLNVDSLGKSLRVTVGEVEPKINWEKLRILVGDELFLELITVKSAEFDADKWRELASEEKVRERDILDVIENLESDSGSVTVAFGKRR